MNKFEKSLNLVFRLNTKDGEIAEIEVDVQEPESGECSRMKFPYSPDEHPEFDEGLCMEIYSWISLWADELEGADEAGLKRNTEISYHYCDASNNKTFSKVVVEGVLTPDEIAQILSMRSEGQFFIPFQVGLPEERFSEYDEQDDHVWFTLPDDAFFPTDREPTESITAAQLLENFKRVDGNWSIYEAHRRLLGY